MKQKRYWLRGGVAGLIFVALASFLALMDRDLVEALIISPPIRWMNFIISYPLYMMFGSKTLFLTNYILYVDYFIIGATIGLVYGKIINRQRGTIMK